MIRNCNWLWLGNLRSGASSVWPQKQPAKAQAELEKAREIFTRLLVPRAASGRSLTPVEMKTETGAKMELQKDGSVFVHQNQPAGNDTYSLVFQSELKGITGLRLEALADSRLPHGGPGWGENGNFVLNELTLQAASAASPEKARSIAATKRVGGFQPDECWKLGRPRSG